jgi:hypothetical protein
MTPAPALNCLKLNANQKKSPFKLKTRKENAKTSIIRIVVPKYQLKPVHIRRSENQKHLFKAFLT